MQARVAALDGLALEEKLAPVRKGSRIIREIAWRWREIGADGRICDLIDAQIGAIEEACGEIASINPLDCVRRHRAAARGTRRQRGRARIAARRRRTARRPRPRRPHRMKCSPLWWSRWRQRPRPPLNSEAAVRASSVLAEEAVATAEAAAMMAETGRGHARDRGRDGGDRRRHGRDRGRHGGDRDGAVDRRGRRSRGRRDPRHDRARNGRG